VSTCKTCAVAADIFSQNVKEWGFDAAIHTGIAKILYHTDCEFVDCYCQHTIDKAEYVRDK
jgi:hypothetical protein